MRILKMTSQSENPTFSKVLFVDIEEDLFKDVE